MGGPLGPFTVIVGTAMRSIHLQAEGANIWSADLARSKSDLNSAKEWPPKPSQENVLECIADLDSMISPLIDAPIFEPDFGTESPKTKAAPPGPEPRTTFAATPVSLEITCALPQQHSPQVCGAGAGKLSTSLLSLL